MTRQGRSERTRHALIRSAAQSFDERGYVQAKLSTISAGAGVSTGALHFHFDTKAAVAAAVEAEATRTLYAFARTVQRQSPNALQALIDTTHVLAQQLSGDVVVRAGFRLNCQAAHRSGADLRLRWHACVTDLLTRARTQGSLAPDLPVAEPAGSIVGATVGFEVLAREDRSWLSAPSVTGLWQSLLPLLVVDASKRPEPSGTHPLTRVQHQNDGSPDRPTTR
ncbi:ScbR family autoregulator-binding transcription factor [Streptomyces pinistramenti]|uniref:ScbR family autoregulator-binding transcription factor n=1 Tax=Streptomyces pinistramenti TaxID=2884812 RepID=UPI001D098790|nr:ScbR family autoregulator-binding transcription factor [Streptomyces pinistramenti]MCB5908961.1 TetR family transcriptional regulator [Streptomyces pinistramenti]